MELALGGAGPEGSEIMHVAYDNWLVENWPGKDVFYLKAKPFSHLGLCVLTSGWPVLSVWFLSHTDTGGARAAQPEWGR